MNNSFAEMPAIIIPFIFLAVYMPTVDYLYFNRRLIVVYSIFIPAASIILCWIILYYILGYNIESALCYTIVLNVIYILGMFIGLDVSFRKAWLKSDKEKYTKYFGPTKPSPEILDYCSRSRIIVAVGSCIHYSIFLGRIFFILTLALSIILNKDVNDNLIWLFLACCGFCSFMFFISISFLRLLSRCDNCDLELYHLGDNISKYLYMCKRVVKDRVIECMHCQATYVLDKKIKLEDIKNSKKQVV